MSESIMELNMQCLVLALLIGSGLPAGTAAGGGYGGRGYGGYGGRGYGG
jgi:hypothetical protein